MVRVESGPMILRHGGQNLPEVAAGGRRLCRNLQGDAGCRRAAAVGRGVSEAVAAGEAAVGRVAQRAVGVAGDVAVGGLGARKSTRLTYSHSCASRMPSFDCTYKKCRTNTKRP